MRRIFVLVVTALAAAILVPAAQADPTCTNTVEDRAVPVPAGLTVPDNHVRVILPQGYATSGLDYPVLLLLHGAGDTYETWVNNTDVETLCLGMIVVMPDAGRNGQAGWYSDWVNNSRDWESFHIGAVVPWIDTTYRTLGDGHRAVAGLSMGGFGAMSYAGRHPGLFAAAASFSGAVDTRYFEPVSGVGFTLAHSQFGTPNDDVWGNQVTNEAEWRAHNPTDLAPALAGTQLFIATGTGTPGGPAGDSPTNPGGYGIEQVIWQMNLSFERALDAAGVAYHDDSYLGGLHDWPYWQMELHHALPFLQDAVGDPQ